MFNALCNGVHSALATFFVAMHGCYSLIDKVLQISPGAIVADRLPDEAWGVEEAALETQHKWNPLVINYKIKHALRIAILSSSSQLHQIVHLNDTVGV